MQKRFLPGAALLAACLIGGGAGAARPPTLTDIIEMKSIDGLTVAPDGRLVAYRVSSPSVKGNQIRSQWYVAGTQPGQVPRAFGTAAEPLFIPNYDAIEDEFPIWSADSRSLFVRRLDGGAIHLHRILAGGQDQNLTKDDADVVSFEAAPDGTALRYKTYAPRAEIERRQAAEFRNGIPLDASLNTDGMRLFDNFSIGTRRTTLRRVGGAGAGEAFRGSLQDKSVALPGGVRIGPAARDDLLAVGDEALGRVLPFDTGGLSIAIEKRSDDEMFSAKTYQLVAILPDGSKRPCAEAFCTGPAAIFRMVLLNQRRGEVVIQYEKNYSARSVFYGWNPVTGATRTLLDADGTLGSGAQLRNTTCPRRGQALFCVHAGAARPPHVVRIDLDDGRMDELADPNAELAAKRFADTQFLEWQDVQGRPGNGILLLPRDRSGPLPLVITSYRCRGFLRGGMAEVAAEHVLVQRGFAALCINSFNDAAYERDADGNPALVAGHKANLAEWQAAVDLLAARGVIDPKRVGASGQSYSSISISYIVSHSDLLQAVAMAAGTTLDPATVFFRGPSADSPMRGYSKVMGLPHPDEDPKGLWKQVSPALNAERIRAAVMMQPPESEYLLALQLHAAIVHAGGTVATYIFPDEGHAMGRYPAQQVARNGRSIDWFAFWLQGREDPDPAKAAEYAGWRKLREARKGQDGKP